MVLGRLDQLPIFWQLHLIELLGLLTGLGLLKLQHLIYPMPLIEFDMVFFTNVGLMKFQVRYLALFLLFSVRGSFGWLWMGILHKNIQLMLKFLKGPYLVLHFSCYKLITFLLMLTVILLSMLMTLLSTLNVIRHIWSVAATRIGFWIWTWSTRHSGLGQEVACGFPWWKNSTSFNWPV